MFPVTDINIAAIRQAIRPLLVDEGPDLPPAPHEELLLDAVMSAIGPLLHAAVAAGYDAGHADGCDAVTELSVMNLVDIELDKLGNDSVQAELTDRIRHRLADPDDPYEIRAATKEIVESVWRVMEGAS